MAEEWKQFLPSDWEKDLEKDEPKEPDAFDELLEDFTSLVPDTATAPVDEDALPVESSTVTTEDASLFKPESAARSFSDPLSESAVKSNYPVSQNILEHMPQFAVHEAGGAHGIKRVTRQPRLRRAAQLPRGWSLSDAIIALVTLIVVGVLSSLILGNHLTELLPRVGRVGIRILLLVVSYGIEIFVLALLAYRRRIPFAEAYRLRRPRLELSEEAEQNSAQGVKNYVLQQKRGHSAKPFANVASVVLALIVASVALRLIAVAWAIIAADFGWVAPEATSLSTYFGTGTFGLLGALLTTALIGPFVEELAFRVLLQEYFAAKMPLVVSIILTSIIFAFCHVSLWALFPIFFLGCVASFFAYRAKTVWPAVIVHVLYNSLTVIAAYYLLAH